MNTQWIQSIVSIIILGITSQTHAGGLYLYEMGTEDLGLAGAGSAARAQDASTVINNPAGMTRLQGDQFVVGAQILYGDVDYEMDNPNQTDPGNIVGWFPGLSTFYSHSVSDDFKIGVGMYGGFGLSLSFDDDWAGRYLVKDSTLLGITLQPTVAYQLNDMWSLGAGLGINYGIFSLTRDSLLTGREKELDDTEIVFNGRIGLLFTPAEKTRLGLTYISKTDYDFDVDGSGTLPSGAAWSLPISATFGAPQQVMFSAVQLLNDKWTILGNIGWQDWSDFSDLDVTVNSIQIASALDLQDTWHGALGTQYQMTQATRLNFGIAYDSSMYNDQDSISLTMPTGAAWRFGTGVQHQLNEQASFGVAFEYMTIEDASVSSPAVLAGSYNDPAMYFFAVNYNYCF
jgi:long-chain fatty acid transport protein